MLGKILLSAIGIAAIASAANAAVVNGVVINEVYGGGGNSGATLTNDFIELYNNSATTPIDISGYQLNYTSATGVFSSPVGTDDSFSTVIPVSTTLAPLTYYLIQESKGTGGTTALTDVNQVDTIAIGGTSFKVQLNDASGAQLDLLGVGTANTFEGTAAAAAASNTTSSARVVAGVDTDNNNLDFISGTPTPMGSGSAVPEPASLGLLTVGSSLLLRRRK